MTRRQEGYPRSYETATAANTCKLLRRCKGAGRPRPSRFDCLASLHCPPPLHCHSRGSLSVLYLPLPPLSLFLSVFPPLSLALNTPPLASGPPPPAARPPPHRPGGRSGTASRRLGSCAGTWKSRRSEHPLPPPPGLGHRVGGPRRGVGSGLGGPPALRPALSLNCRASFHCPPPLPFARRTFVPPSGPPLPPRERGGVMRVSGAGGGARIQSGRASA